MNSQWHAVWQTLLPLLGWSKGSEKAVKKIVIEFILASGVIGAIVAEFLNGNPWLIFGLLLPCVAGLAAVIALALDRTSRGPVIAIGNLKPDGAEIMFEVRVDNCGSGEVVARAYLVELTTRQGRNPHLGPDVEISWRGGPKPKLSRNKPGWVGVFLVDKTTPDSPTLKLSTPPLEQDDPMSIRTIDIADGPLNKQRELRVMLRVEFLGETGDRLASERKGFAVIPDRNASMCYRVHPLGLFHGAVEGIGRVLDRFRSAARQYRL